ncbi:MAG: NTE family protein [Planctomycetota bacterium]|jgi:NTE family protein
MKIGLALSGGGARGIAQIGAIKALEEFNIFPTHISGTSAGAAIGALYASGASCAEMLQFFKSTSLFTRTKFAYNKPGFINTDKFYNDFKAKFPIDNFNALKKPLFITATNIVKGTLEYFNKGELITPILASASFPGVFTPVKMNDNYYIDGGTLNNFPIEPLKEVCDKIIGIYVNPLKDIVPSDLRHSYSVMDRAFEINTSSLSLMKFSQCDLLISPAELNKYGTFSVKDLDTIYDIGYQYTKKVLTDNPNIVKQFYE